MWRITALLIASLLAGCAADGQKPWYEDALRDLRGDNQEMRGFSSSSK